ncbi:acyltransferase family protein [Paeniroseomonas aquatica]|uniref:Acyltransferase family protein n=1 Tax=Paeniroseomonas aquatica TaxID=373043 RepID=A0ABT8AA89_9PROT|nr:acyltransferase family protein [Paeniroseomonas aquatica]MDN3566747.1 acyltransferase family protein [Paeniroseomonas aquatica]
MTRNHALDSLRGLAALAVALGHCILAVTGLATWGATVFDFPQLPAAAILARLGYVAFPSDAAVIVFFVLSGHVLWQACGRHPGGLLGGMPDWTLARLYRLLPVAMACAIPLGLLHDASAARLVGNMLLLSYDLNGPAWSLQVEVVASLLLFPLHRLLRGRTAGLLLALGLTVALLPWLRQVPVLVYLPMFLAGALIGAVPARWWRGWVLALGLPALLLGSLVLGHGTLSRGAELVGAVAVVGTLGQWQPRWLLHPALRFLGRISYPFYLSHALGLALAAPLVAAAGLAGTFGPIALYAVLSLAITIPVAWALHHAVEAPLMRARPRLRPLGMAPAPAE